MKKLNENKKKIDFDECFIETNRNKENNTIQMPEFPHIHIKRITIFDESRDQD
jgi:hypothetical protein